MTNFVHGRIAEDSAAKFLQHEGYKILVRNWRTRFCEIDIVAANNRIIYFVEVKYRKSGQQGTGLEYVTPKKLQQMELAARFWIQEEAWEGDYRLSAIEVSGAQYQVTEFITEL